MARPHVHKRAATAAAVSILAFLGALTAVWAAPRLSDAVAAWMATPLVRSATLSMSDLSVSRDSRATTEAGIGTGRTSAAVIDAGLRFTMLGMTCAPPARRGEVTVLLRTSDDGVAWSDWYAVPLERAAENGRREQAFIEAVWTGPGRYAQVAARTGAGAGAPLSLRDVRLVAINSTEDADTAAAVVGTIRRAAASVAGIDLTPPAAAMTKKPAIITRSQWGANESWRGESPSYATVKMAFIHHTVSGNGYSADEAAAVVRGVYRYHTKSLHWSDIGYNFLVDRYGRIYEGRYGGMTRGVIGAQVLGFNTGTTGISMIGTYSGTTPTSASVTALEHLLEWKLDVHHIDPLSTPTVRCNYGQKFKNGQKVKFNAIAGHRDANFTDCPGGRLYGLLPSIRKVVARTGQPKIYGFVASVPAISPNGDGVLDDVDVGFTVSELGSWRLDISNDAGTVVRSEAGEGTTVDVIWDGKDDKGATVPDGTYTLEAAASSPSGEARPATATVVVDTVAPKVESTGIAPDPFSPNGDGHADTAKLTFVPGESGSARVSVVGDGDKVLRRLTGWKAVSTAARSVLWDGRVGSGDDLVAADEGTAALEVEVRDGAGNAASARRSVTLDRTLSFGSLAPPVFSPNGDGVLDSCTVEFKLTRSATVSFSVLKSGDAVKTLHLGKLAPGAHSAAWDGALSGGGTADSGGYNLRVTADGSVGASSVSDPVTVDLVPPRVTAPAKSRVRLGRRASISYKPVDPYSKGVKVLVAVTTAKGRKTASLGCGWVRQGKAHVLTWRPRHRGTYALVFTAIDKGGNRATAVATTRLRVR